MMALTLRNQVAVRSASRPWRFPRTYERNWRHFCESTRHAPTPMLWHGGMPLPVRTGRALSPLSLPPPRAERCSHATLSRTLSGYSLTRHDDAVYAKATFHVPLRSSVCTPSASRMRWSSSA